MRSILAPLTVLLLALTACGGDEAPPPAPAPAPAAEPAPAPAPPPAPVEPAPTEAPAPGTPMSVDAINAARESNVGNMVTINGFYGNMTKQDAPAQINVIVYQDAELVDKHSVFCVVDVADEATITALTQKAPVTITGTIGKDDFFGAAKVEGCKVAAGDAAPAAPAADMAAEGEGAEGGKAGKGKGKGGDGEGGKAGKGKGKKAN